MKVALILLPEWQGVTPPLALAYLKTSIIESGHDCKAMDFAIEYENVMGGVKRQIMSLAMNDEQKKLFNSYSEKIISERPDVLAFSLLAENLEVTEYVCAQVKMVLPDVRVISGGAILTKPEVSRIAHALRFSDIAIEGEGEHAIVEVLNCFRNGTDPRQVKNTWFLHNGEPVYSGGDSRLVPLDTIGFPNFDDFDFNKYLCKGRIPMLFSRGCILNCTFCTNKWNHRTQRTRSGENVFQELLHNIERYKINEFMFNDDSLISRITWDAMQDFCMRMITHGRVMRWEIFNTRVDKLLVGNNVKLLAKAGLSTTTLGVESFSAEVQRDMGKASTPEIATQVTRDLVDNGVETRGLFIYGYPSETEEDFVKTLDWFKENGSLYSSVSVNVFGPNFKYVKDRPGVINYNSHHPEDWQSAHCNLEQRKSRFLRLVEVLATNRLRNPKAAFFIGDPHYTRHFTGWTQKDIDEVSSSWKAREESMKVIRNV